MCHTASINSVCYVINIIRICSCYSENNNKNVWSHVLQTCKTHHALILGSYEPRWLGSNEPAVHRSPFENSLSGQAFDKGLPNANIKSRFQACGIYPLNRNICPEHYFLPSQVSDRDLPGPAIVEPPTEDMLWQSSMSVTASRDNLWVQERLGCDNGLQTATLHFQRLLGGSI